MIDLKSIAQSVSWSVSKHIKWFGQTHYRWKTRITTTHFLVKLKDLQRGCWLNGRNLEKIIVLMVLCNEIEFYCWHQESTFHSPGLVKHSPVNPIRVLSLLFVLYESIKQPCDDIVTSRWFPPTKHHALSAISRSRTSSFISTTWKCFNSSLKNRYKVPHHKWFQGNYIIVQSSMIWSTFEKVSISSIGPNSSWRD